MIDEAVIGVSVAGGRLDERGMRRRAAAEAVSLGRGGRLWVSRATGIAEWTIRHGRREVASGTAGGGPYAPPGNQAKAADRDRPAAASDVERLVDHSSRGAAALAGHEPSQPRLKAASPGPSGIGRVGGATAVAPRLQPAGNAKTREGARATPTATLSSPISTRPSRRHWRAISRSTIPGGSRPQDAELAAVKLDGNAAFATGHTVRLD